MRKTWTHEDLITLVERVRVNLRGPTVDSLTGEDLADPGPESALASKIVAHAKAQGWPCLYMKPLKNLQKIAIWLDITLALPLGRVIFLELKERKGVLRDKQRLVFNMLKQLGHEVYIVKSFKAYLKIVEGD